MTQIKDDELLITREFAAPAALVFRLWESRDYLIRWWGPEEFTGVELDWELTPGRPWRGAMSALDYGLLRFGGVIREVEKNKRIVFTFQWDKDSGRDRDTLVTVTLSEKDGKTIQTFHQTPFSTVAIRDSHVSGWSSMFNKLKTHAENFAVAAQKGVRP